MSEKDLSVTGNIAERWHNIHKMALLAKRADERARIKFFGTGGFGDHAHTRSAAVVKVGEGSSGHGSQGRQAHAAMLRD